MCRSTFINTATPLRNQVLGEMATGKGGYDHDFVKAPPKSLECPVCLLTFRDPHVISCCGNEFCQLCIERIQREGKACPLCNEPKFTTFLHKKLVREVNALVVRCPQKEMSCEWEGELGQVEQHLSPGAGPSSSSGCDYVIVECRYQCGAHLQRRMVGEHEMESCPKRPIEMQVAGLMRKFEVITAENKMLKQELVEMKQAYKCELTEMKLENEKQREELNKKNVHLQRVLKKVQVSYDELKKKQEAIKVDVDEQKLKCVSLQTHTTPLPVPPFYFTASNMDLYRKNNGRYDSQPFYSHPGGYKMSVSVFPNGYASYKGTHLRLAVYIQRGEFDDQLRWPFNGRVTFQAYNFTTEQWSNERTLVLSQEEWGLRTVSRCMNVQSHGGLGYNDFLSLSELYKHYIASDTDISKFRVTKVEI